MRILLLAAGTGSRWKKSGAVGLKQFTEVDGEAIIRRTFRQLADRGHEVCTMVQDPANPVWSGLNPRQAAEEPWMGEMGKFLHGRPCWPESGLVTILYGDVFYTDQVLDVILGHEPDQPTIYGRANAPGRRLESFAIRFDVDRDLAEVERVCQECASRNWHRKGGAWRWFHMRHANGRPYGGGREVKRLATPENGWVELPLDETDDFDKVSDLVRWRKEFGHA